MAQMNDDSGYLDKFYHLIGATNIRRTESALPYTTGLLSDRLGARRYINEKVLDNRWLRKYLTVTVDLPREGWGDGRGEFYESVAHWLVRAYRGQDGDLAAVCVCNLQALQDYLKSENGPGYTFRRGEKYVEVSEGHPFLRVPLALLLHHRPAANVVVAAGFTEEGMEAYAMKCGVARIILNNEGRGRQWSDRPVCSYRSVIQLPK